MRRERLPSQVTIKRGLWALPRNNFETVLLGNNNVDNQATRVLLSGQFDSRLNVLAEVKKVRGGLCTHSSVGNVVAHDQFSRVALETRIQF